MFLIYFITASKGESEQNFKMPSQGRSGLAPVLDFLGPSITLCTCYSSVRNGETETPNSQTYQATIHYLLVAERGRHIPNRIHMPSFKGFLLTLLSLLHPMDMEPGLEHLGNVFQNSLTFH